MARGYIKNRHVYRAMGADTYDAISKRAWAAIAWRIAGRLDPDQPRRLLMGEVNGLFEKGTLDAEDLGRAEKVLLKRRGPGAAS